MIRKYLKPGTQLVVRFSVRERDLVIEKAFLDSDVDTALPRATVVGSRLVVNLSLDDIDNLLGCVVLKRIIARTARSGVCSTPSAVGSAHCWTDSLTRSQRRGPSVQCLC